MYSAEKAREETGKVKANPSSNWSFLESLQLKRILRKIKKAVANGAERIYIRTIMPLVKLKLEELGYAVYELCRIPGTDIKQSVSISWSK